MKNINFGDISFLLSRHGTTKLNEKEKYRGWSDDPEAALDDNGIKQAKIAGQFLNRLPIYIDFIYCSDLDRAIHTAAIIAGILGIKDIHPDKRLRPLDVGELAGESKSDNPIHEYLDDKNLEFPGGESVDDFEKRQEDFSEDLFKRIAVTKGKILVVGHLSNIVYWNNVMRFKQGVKDEDVEDEAEYSNEKEDLILPGGVVAVMKNDNIVPLLGENPKAK